MPKNKKESSTDSDSGPEDRTPAKKAKSGNASEGGGGDEGFSLNGTKRKATVSEFKGRVYVNIREYYEKDGKMLPSKKGISLTVPEWKKLLEHADEITEITKKF